MQKEIITLERVVVKKCDGSIALTEDALTVKIGAPMWFGEELINEINSKEEIEVIVIKDYDGNNHVHLTNADEE